MKTLRFYFDFISPYSFLALTQVKDWPAQKPVEIEYIPILFAAVLNHHGTQGPAEIPGKRAYTFRDVWRWARHYGLEIEGPPSHPFNPLASLRLATAAEPAERAGVVAAIFNACWRNGRDISKYDELVKVVTEAGFDGKALREKSASKDVKQKLMAQTQEAIDIGVFGVPALYIDEELFWGNDRLVFIENIIDGKYEKPDEAKLQEAINRPSSASRR